MIKSIKMMFSHPTTPNDRAKILTFGNFPKTFFLLCSCCALVLFSTLQAQAQEWQQLGPDIDGEVPDEQSGQSVSLSADGQIVAIGAYKKRKGTVRVYQYVGTGWEQLGSDIDGEAAGDGSSGSLTLSADGKTVAIGTGLNDGKNGSNSGHVRVYEYKNNKWTQLGADIDGEAAGDQSGWSVSLSADGKIVAIGAPSNSSRGNNAGGNSSGHVRVYEYKNNNWEQLGTDIDGEEDFRSNTKSGTSVSLSADGKTLAIGAPLNSGNGLLVGHVRVYKLKNTWTQVAADIDGKNTGDKSGTSVRACLKILYIIIL